MYYIYTDCIFQQICPRHPSQLQSSGIVCFVWFVFVCLFFPGITLCGSVIIHLSSSRSLSTCRTFSIRLGQVGAVRQPRQWYLKNHIHALWLHCMRLCLFLWKKQWLGDVECVILSIFKLISINREKNTVCTDWWKFDENWTKNKEIMKFRRFHTQFFL